MVVEAKFTGYVMTVGNRFDWVCVVVLVVHGVIAVAHVSWCLWIGETGEAWDTIPELVALCLQSDPVVDWVLDHANGGIRTMQTIESVAMIETRSSGSSWSSETTSPAAEDEVQLRVRPKWEKRRQDCMVERSKYYGS
jgi:hypothetical protein